MCVGVTAMKQSFSIFGIHLILLLVSGSVFAQQSDDQNESFSQAELDQMLAPVALYPDSVLSQLLIAATYPLEVVMAERWTRDNPGLKGAEAVEAADSEDWDASVKALVAFPDLLKRMSSDLEWTEQLGEAFLVDEEQVLDSVQDLRQRAYETGNLDDLEHLAVSRDADRQIVIEPVVREVVYIPYYDTRVVYGPWWWADYQPRYWHDHHHSHWVHWGPRVRISGHFFFSAFRWDHRRVVVIDHRYRSHRYYRTRHIARHQHARHWQHNPQHRRGVEYRNPRTRDYFQRKHREQSDRSRYSRSVRSDVKQAQPHRRPEQGAIKRQLRDGDRAIKENRAYRVKPNERLRQKQPSAGASQQRRLRPSTESHSSKTPRRELKTHSPRGGIQRDSKAQGRARASESAVKGQSARPTRHSGAEKRSRLKAERNAR